MSNIIPMFYIFILSLTISNRFKCGLGRGYSLTALIVVFVEYSFGLINRLNYGFYFLIILSIFSIVYWAINIRELKTIVFNNANCIAFFVISFILTLIHHRYSVPSTWDECAQWALSAKYSYLTNYFEAHAGSNAIYPDYPPGTALFQYFWMNCGRSWNDGHLYVSMCMLIVCFLSPILDEVKTKQVYKIILTDIALLTSILIVYPNAYCSLTVDCLMGVVFAYILFLIKLENDNTFRTVSLSLSAFCLTIIKNSAIIFCIFAFVYYLFQSIYKKNVKLISTCCIPISSIFAFLSWKWYLSMQHTSTTFKLSISDIKQRISSVQDFQKIGFANYYKSIFNHKVIDNTMCTAFHIGHLEVPLVIIILLLLILSIFICKKRNDNWRFTFGVLFSEFLVYIFMTSILYITSFGEDELAVLSSMNRYLGTFIVGIVLFFLYFIIVSPDFERKMLPIFSLLLFILISDIEAKNIFLRSINPVLQSSTLNNYSSFMENDPKASFIRQHISDTDSVHIFNGDLAAMNYFLTPVCAKRPYWASVDFDYFPQNAENYDYIFFDNMLGSIETTEFKEKYSIYFSNKEEMYNGGLYEVCRFNNGNPYLIYVDKYNYNL